MERADVIKLVQDCLSGDPSRQEALVIAVQNRVYYHCKKMLRDEQDALDATQDILIVMLTKLGTLREVESFWSWLGGITANRCRKLIDRERRTVQIPEDEEGNSLLDDYETLDEQTVPDKVLDNEETQRMIVELVDALPAEQRICVLMYYYDELSVKEIAEALEVSEGTIKSRLNYARKAIKKGVDAYTAQGIKLYSFSPIPFLLYFLGKDAAGSGMSSSAFRAMTEVVLASGGTAAASSAASGVVSGAAARRGMEGATVAAGKAGNAIGILAHKGALAAVVLTVVGAVTAGSLLLLRPASQPESAPAAAMTEKEPAAVIEVAEAEDPVCEGIGILPIESVLYPGAQVSLIVYDASSGKEIPWHEVTWTVETPESASVKSGELSVTGRSGTAVLTASWNGYQAQSKIHIIPQDDQVWCSCLSTVMYVGYLDNTYLHKESADRFGTGYTVEWSVDRPDVLAMEPGVTETGEHYVLFEAQNYGEAVITCRVTWPDGTVRQCYCNVYVYFRLNT